MVAYTDTYGFNKGTAAAGDGKERYSFISVRVDMAKVVAARLAAGATALAAADTLQILQVPAGFLILQGGINVDTAETTNTTGTFDVGFTGGSPAAANVFGNDVANNSVAQTATALAAPLLITTADTIDVLFNTAATLNAVFTVWLAGINTVSAR